MPKSKSPPAGRGTGAASPGFLGTAREGVAGGAASAGSRRSGSPDPGVGASGSTRVGGSGEGDAGRGLSAATERGTLGVVGTTRPGATSRPGKLRVASCAGGAAGEPAKD